MRWFLAVLVLGVLVAPAVAFAHAEPAQLRPGSGAVLTSAPLAVEILMTQEMARQPGANDIDVFDAKGGEVTTVAAVIDNGNRKRLTVALPSTLAPGAYTVKWKTLSAEDGDAADGSYPFTVDPSGTASKGDEGGGADPAPPPSPGAGGGGAAVISPGADDSTWIFALATGLGGVAIGAAVTFLLVRRQA
ncbi:MAG: copper resistance protein CopC [Dehalococcoidia bacterium]